MKQHKEHKTYSSSLLSRVEEAKSKVNCKKVSQRKMALSLWSSVHSAWFRFHKELWQ